MYPCYRPWSAAFTVALLFLFASGALLFFSSAAVAQQDVAQDAVQQAKLSKAGEEAFQKYQQGDAAGAIALLEGQRGDGALTRVDMAMLGTLYIEAGRAAEGLEVLRPIADAEAADPAVLYNAGRAALAANQIEAAISYLERSVRQMPVSPAARELGMLRGALAQHEEAYRLLRPWVERNQGDLQARLAAIASALQIGRAFEVGSWFQGLPTGDPKFVVLRGQYLAQTGDPPSAILAFESILENHPPEMSSDLFRTLASAYIDVGRAADAVELLKGKLGQESFGQDPRIALILAKAHHQEGELDAALAALAPFARLAITESAPKEQIVFQTALDYGRLLVADGRAEEAMPFLTRATDIDPQNPLAWKNLGDALTSLGRRDEAAKALEKYSAALARGTELERQQKVAAEGAAGGAVHEANLAMVAGEPQRALAILRQEIALSPNNPQVRLLEIRLLMILERFEEALKSAAAALELAPDHADLLYSRGATQMALKSTAAAEMDFRRVLELKSEHTAAMNDLAVILILQGAKSEARALLERVLELRPDDETARGNLERLKS